MFRGAQRAALAKQLAISHTEKIEEKLTLELGTVLALMTEIEMRVPPPEKTLLVEPTIAHLFAEGRGEDAPSQFPQAEQEKWAQRVEEAEHIYIVVHSEAPSHYTLVEVHKHQHAKPTIEFRDSLKTPPDTARQAATRVLRRLELIDEAEECPMPCNEAFQSDGWSCGIWAARWLERSLRELRGEARVRPASIKDIRVRGNEFINKLKDYASKPEPKKKPEPKAKAAKEYKTNEPKFDCLEDAREAAHLCTKCLYTKVGTKGCRACMGEWFEEVRLCHKGKKVREC